MGILGEAEAQAHRDGVAVAEGAGEAEDVARRGVRGGPGQGLDAEALGADPGALVVDAVLEARQRPHPDPDHLRQGRRGHRLGEGEHHLLHRGEAVGAGGGDGLHRRGHEGHQVPPGAAHPHREPRQRRPGAHGAEEEGVVVDPAPGPGPARREVDEAARVVLGAGVARVAVEEDGHRVVAPEEGPGDDLRRPGVGGGGDGEREGQEAGEGGAAEHGDHFPSGARAGTRPAESRSRVRAVGGGPSPGGFRPRTTGAMRTGPRPAGQRTRRR